MITERKFQPVIIFSFSRRECEQHAMSVAKLDFNTQEEKDTVEHVFRNAIECLKEEDRDLPAIELMLPLLQQGIAVHHSGLLPVIKELVEILFQEGLIKALFATETVRLSPGSRLLCFTFSLYVIFAAEICLVSILHDSFVTVCYGFEHACENCCFHSCEEVGW